MKTCAVIRWPSSGRHALHLNIDPNPLTPHLPNAFENRLTRWHQLEDGLKEMVHAEISAVQDRMDKIFPLRNPLT